MKKIYFENFSQRKRVNFVNSLSGFKSANLVGTKSGEGITNLAMMSSAVHIGADPALIALVIRPDTVRRDTLENIRETKYATMNHVSVQFFQKGHQTSARYPGQVSEFDATGLKELYLDDFYAPFVEQSKLKYSLKLQEEKKIEINETNLLILEIMSVYLEEQYILEEGQVDLEAMETVTVSSLNSYHRTDLLERLPYAKA